MTDRMQELRAREQILAISLYYWSRYHLPDYPPVRVLMQLGLWHGREGGAGSRAGVTRRSSSHSRMNACIRRILPSERPIRMDYHQQAVRATTKRLREDQQSGWSRLREFLDEQGIRPTDVALAVINPDDVSELVAVVVQSRSRMFEILLDYPRGLDLSLAMSEATVSSSDHDAERIFNENVEWVEAALRVLADEGEGGST
jgi:phage I-like protein